MSQLELGLEVDAGRSVSPPSTATVFALPMLQVLTIPAPQRTMSPLRRSRLETLRLLMLPVSLPAARHILEYLRFRPFSYLCLICWGQPKVLASKPKEKSTKNQSTHAKVVP